MGIDIDIDNLMALGILNLRPMTRGGAVVGVRGESLSGRNRKFLYSMKGAGIHTIIDLRTADHTRKFLPACEALGLRYLNFPIDQAYTTDAEIIRDLPLMWNAMASGGFYIACALGLHRTDMALALWFLFDPRAQEVPILPGHHREGVFKYEDIFRRANSVYRSLTPQGKAAWGWDEAFDGGFDGRKKQLTRVQKEYLAGGAHPLQERA